MWQILIVTAILTMALGTSMVESQKVVEAPKIVPKVWINEIDTMNWIVTKQSGAELKYNVSVIQEAGVMKLNLNDSLLKITTKIVLVEGTDYLKIGTDTLLIEEDDYWNLTNSYRSYYISKTGFQVSNEPNNSFADILWQLDFNGTIYDSKENIWAWNYTTGTDFINLTATSILPSINLKWIANWYLNDLNDYITITLSTNRTKSYIQRFIHKDVNISNNSIIDYFLLDEEIYLDEIINTNFTDTTTFTLGDNFTGEHIEMNYQNDSIINFNNGVITLYSNMPTLVLNWVDPPADKWRYTIFLYDLKNNTNPSDDIQLYNETIIVDEGSSTGVFKGLLSIANLSMNSTYWFFIKGNTTEADYNYDGTNNGETYIVSTKYCDNAANSWNLFHIGTKEYFPTAFNVPTDFFEMIDVMFWSTVFNASITESVADRINYSLDANILESKTFVDANVACGTNQDSFVSFAETEYVNGDSDPEGAGFTGWNSADMTAGKFYYWGVMFIVNDNWVSGEFDINKFHHGGKAGDSSQEVSWNWTIINPPIISLVDSCTYSGSGNFIIACADNCSTTATNVLNNNVIITGSGRVTINVNNYNSIRISECKVLCQNCTR